MNASWLAKVINSNTLTVDLQSPIANTVLEGEQT